jgi:hypothetical protein
MHFVVIGAGNMGCVYGANLARSGQDVSLLDIWEEHIRKIQDDGLHLTGLTGDFTLRVRAASSPAALPKADVALICVNAYATSLAAETACAMLKDDGYALTLQNGVGNIETLSEKLGRERVLAGLSFQSADLVGPGLVRHTNNGPTYIGELDRSRSPRLETLRGILETAGLNPVVVDDVIATIWSKFVHNCGINALCAITGLRHSGASVRVDRGSRPPVMLRNPALTVGTSPQPDVLESLSDKPGFRGRGLIARFLFGLPVSPIGFRELKPIPCPSAVEKAYCGGVERLLKLAPPIDEAGHWQPWRLRFSSRAYDAWKDFQRAIEILMREGRKLYYLKDWGSKLPGAAARIAGVIHCVLVDPNESTVISEDAVEGALNLVTPLMDHALAVFNLMERDKNSEDAQKILDGFGNKGKRLSLCGIASALSSQDSRRWTVSGSRLAFWSNTTGYARARRRRRRTGRARCMTSIPSC